MALSPGDKLGPYEIVEPIGQGGMGAVYRARDTRLGRDVAVKVSQEHFSERFAREARAISSLNHPNICTLYDTGENYLVMELVEGKTLAERIKQGSIPLDEALKIGRQITEALEAAHEKGITHRDLKPGNIMLKPDGSVKVLDFGLAKVSRANDPTGSGMTTQSMSLTETGVVMGTAGYMSPEQASGKPVDHRSDIWAFGVILYEMLTGRRPFPGDSMQDILAGILAREPDLSLITPGMRPLVEKCLRKDPRLRWQAIGDVRLALEEGPRPDSALQPANASVLPWTVAAVLAIALIVVVFYVPTRTETEDPHTIAFGVPIPGGEAQNVQFALSPDGTNLAIAAVVDGRRNLWLRPLESLNARLLPETEDAVAPFWSPDGSEIGFQVGDGIRKVEVSIGRVSTIRSSDAGSGRSAAWLPSGDLVRTHDRRLWVVDSDGVEREVGLDSAGPVSDPSPLPDGNHILLTMAAPRHPDSGIWVVSVNDGEATHLLPDLSRAEFVPNERGKEEGYLVFRRSGILSAQPFDLNSLTLSGEAISLTESSVINMAKYGPSVLFSTSLTGQIAYQTEAVEQLVWVGRDGSLLEPVGPPGQYDNFRLSPDESKVVMNVNRFEGSSSANEIATLDLRRGILNRITFDEDADVVPVFSPDGRQIAFTSNRNGGFDPYITTGPGEERILADLRPEGGWPLDWSPDGDILLYQASGDDLWRR